MDDRGMALVTGARGFVGRHLAIGLEAAGYRVRRASRRPPRDALDDQRWCRLDVERPETLEPALRGCRVAYYLVHQVGTGPDYAQRELRSARAFQRACQRAGVERIVYLGGPVPHEGRLSPHLASRQACGEALRGGAVPAFELRAALIIGAGGSSWRMLRDLAERLPAMLLPRWLRFCSWPVAIDDVVRALLACAELPLGESGCYAATGGERVSHRELLRRTATALGRRPLLLDVPILTPRLSSYWIAAVTRTRFKLARELVQGITCDLEPSAPPLWPLLPAQRPLDLDVAIENALADGGVRGRMRDLGLAHQQRTAA